MSTEYYNKAVLSNPGASAAATAAFHFLSELLRRRVRCEGESACFGRLRDIGAAFAAPYPQAV